MNFGQQNGCHQFLEERWVGINFEKVPKDEQEAWEKNLNNPK